jgi:diguanylate cyclase (GGDEF)-like protein
MLKDIKITQKIPLIMITFALLSAIATGFIAYNKTASSMKETARDNLQSLLSSRKSALQQYFDTIIHQITFHAKSPLIIKSIKDFDAAWQVIEDDKGHRLKQLYIHENPYTKGRKGAFLTALDGSKYSQVHQKTHPYLSNMIDTDAYYDLFLINTAGDLIYSVQKEADFSTNLLNGKWQNTSLAKLFQQINTGQSPGVIHISDFSPYHPSSDEPASFIGTAIFDLHNKYLGVLVLQLPIEPIDRIMQVSAGMGRSGETYVVGPDLLMRSNSRFFQDRSILMTTVDSTSVHRALLGETGFGVIEDYRQIPVYSSFTPISVLSMKWAMVAEIDQAEVLQPVYEMSQFLLIGGLLLTLVILIVGYLISTDISQPIVAMTNMMKKLSNNELSINISVNERKDEIGNMADAMVVFRQNAIEREHLKDQLSKIADQDTLTGLYTRKFAMEHLQTLIDGAQLDQSKLVLMFIDLDNFKQINDEYGHYMGDKTLCNIAEHLRSCVREQDVVARIGGDEFIILFPHINNTEIISSIANEIVKSTPPQVVPLSLSIGISVFPDDTTNAIELLKNADIAMYNVKKAGKNNYCFWQQDIHSVKYNSL